MSAVSGRGPIVGGRPLAIAVPSTELRPPSGGDPGFYRVVEPPLSPFEAAVYASLRANLPRVLGPLYESLDGPGRADRLARAVEEYLTRREPGLSDDARARLRYYLVRDGVGYGPVDALLRDPDVEDVSVDGTATPVYVVHRRFGSLATNVVFATEDELNAFVVRLSQRVAGAVATIRPVVEGHTPEGHRVEATYGREVSGRGPSVTIRRAPSSPFTPSELERRGTVSHELLIFLTWAVRTGQSLAVIGGPGVGKTSTLNAILHVVPPGLKVVSIEDVRELDLPHEHWLATVRRAGRGDRGADGRRVGEIDLYDLLRLALRERPDRLVVGEVRGREASLVFQAIATGHPTYTTMHADSLASLVRRLESPPISIPRILLASLPFVVVQRLTSSAAGPVRRITEVVEIVGLEPDTDELLTNRLFAFDPGNGRWVEVGPSVIYERWAEANDAPSRPPWSPPDGATSQRVDAPTPIGSVPAADPGAVPSADPPVPAPRGVR